LTGGKKNRAEKKRKDKNNEAEGNLASGSGTATGKTDNSTPEKGEL